MTATIGNPEIAALIPHAGAMCLLESIRFWDSTTIVCMASSHRDAENPLASDGRLDAVCGIEYAAQTMAVHGGLTAAAGSRPAAGFLASVRDVACHVAWLHSLPGDLEVTAIKQAGAKGAAVYEFILRCGESTILTGRAAVVIDPAQLVRPT